MSELFWRCRRGMLELDILLQRFYHKCYPALSDTDKVLFSELLELDDPTLWACLMGNETPPEKFSDLIQTIANTPAE